MGIILGSEKCYKKRTVSGGLSVFFEWFDAERDEIGAGEPTMFISRADRFGLSGNRGSAAIQLPQAHLYADSKSGAPTFRLIQFARQACAEIGLEASRMNVKAIADAIVDNLPDLVSMPPAPSADKFHSRKAPSIGEMSLIAGGKTVVESEVTRH